MQEVTLDKNYERMLFPDNLTLVQQKNFVVDECSQKDSFCQLIFNAKEKIINKQNKMKEFTAEKKDIT